MYSKLSSAGAKAHNLHQKLDMPLLPCRLSNDFLLPTMITFLNDRDWQTRAAFFRDVPCMAAQAGFAGMEAFLLPCVEQAGTHLHSRYKYLITFNGSNCLHRSEVLSPSPKCSLKGTADVTGALFVGIEGDSCISAGTVR